MATYNRNVFDHCEKWFACGKQFQVEDVDFPEKEHLFGLLVSIQVRVATSFRCGYYFENDVYCKMWC